MSLRRAIEFLRAGRGRAGGCVEVRVGWFPAAVRLGGFVGRRPQGRVLLSEGAGVDVGMRAEAGVLCRVRV